MGCHAFRCWRSGRNMVDVYFLCGGHQTGQTIEPRHAHTTATRQPWALLPLSGRECRTREGIASLRPVEAAAGHLCMSEINSNARSGCHHFCLSLSLCLSLTFHSAGREGRWLSSAGTDTQTQRICRAWRGACNRFTAQSGRSTAQRGAAGPRRVYGLGEYRPPPTSLSCLKIAISSGGRGESRWAALSSCFPTKKSCELRAASCERPDWSSLCCEASVVSFFGEASLHKGGMVLRPPCFLSLCYPPPRPWQRAFSPPPRMPHPRGPGRTAYLGSRILRARWGQMRPVRDRGGDVERLIRSPVWRTHFRRREERASQGRRRG